MGKIFKTTSPFVTSHEDNAPPVKDEWLKRAVIQTTHGLDQLGAKVRDLEAVLHKVVEKKKVNEWEVQPVQSSYPSHTIEVPLIIRTTFGKLEEDFSDLSNRIVSCNDLTNCLSKFEEELEDYDAKYLSWFVSALKDVFCYNYAEMITEEQLGLLKKGVEMIYEKQEYCDKDSFAEYHLLLVESGLSLLPTTQKAIDKFGE